MAEEQKKRTMEALERRFAQAKAEIHHQQNHKHQKISVTTTGNNTKSSSPSQLKSTAPSSSKKGFVSLPFPPSFYSVRNFAERFK